MLDMILMAIYSFVAYMFCFIFFFVQFCYIDLLSINDQDLISFLLYCIFIQA